MEHKLWKLNPSLPDSLAETGLPPLLVQLLVNRGITGKEAMEAFIAGDERLVGSPFSLPDMEKAVGRVHRAILSGERTAVVGDFDADGVTGTAVLARGFAVLGMPIVPYIPHRFHEGRGLGAAALDALLKQGITLAITVDCGISDRETALRASERGIDIIVVDHHSLMEEPPPAFAFINPKRKDSSYSYLHMTGVGVAFKFIQAIFASLGKGEPPEELLDLVAVGTVADVAPLVGENRYLVKRGLEVLNRAPRLGLQMMLAQTGLQQRLLDADTISWIVAPRLNASGRLDNAMLSYSLLVSDSVEEARRLATTLEEMNKERQQHTDEVVSRARAKILSRDPEAPLFMVEGEDFFPGVIGLAAGKLSDEFNRPVVLISIAEGASRGSGRSIPAFDMIAAIAECRHLLTRFGGHPRAVGFTIPTGNIPVLQEQLLQIATQSLKGVDLRQFLVIDAEVSPSALVGQSFRQLQKLAPFGYGNPQPVFLARDLGVERCWLVGNNGRHLRLKLRQDKAVWYGVSFGSGNLGGEVKAGSRLDFVYNLGTDRWCGEERLELKVLDFRPS